jgi:hypothetical protein
MSNMSLTDLTQIAVSLVAEQNHIDSASTSTPKPAVPHGPLFGAVFLIPMLENLLARHHNPPAPLQPAENVLPIRPTNSTPVPLHDTLQ